MRATVYVASWCDPCHEAVAYLRGQGVVVTESDVDESGFPPGVSELPTTVFETGQRVVGFNKDKLDAAMGRTSQWGMYAGSGLAVVGLLVAAYILKKR